MSDAQKIEQFFRGLGTTLAEQVKAAVGTEAHAVFVTVVPVVIVSGQVRIEREWEWERETKTEG